MSARLRPAMPTDAALLARLSDMADEGLPRLFWEKLARDGADLWSVGAAQFARVVEDGGDGALIIAETGAETGVTTGASPSGGIWTYPMIDPGDPDAVPFADLAPLRRLKAHMRGDWYIDFLAVLPEHRGQGLGRRLLAGALEAARHAGARRIGLIALDSNQTAQALYGTAGFVAVASEPMLNAAWKTGAANALLMTRAL